MQRLDNPTLVATNDPTSADPTAARPGAVPPPLSMPAHLVLPTPREPGVESHRDADDHEALEAAIDQASAVLDERVKKPARPRKRRSWIAWLFAVAFGSGALVTVGVLLIALLGAGGAAWYFWTLSADQAAALEELSLMAEQPDAADATDEVEAAVEAEPVRTTGRDPKPAERTNNAPRAGYDAGTEAPTADKRQDTGAASSASSSTTYPSSREKSSTSSSKPKSKPASSGSTQHTIKLLTSPPAALLTVDGKAAGRTPAKLKLTEGAHEMVVKSGRESASFRLVVKDGGADRWCYDVDAAKVYEGGCL